MNRYLRRSIKINMKTIYMKDLNGKELTDEDEGIESCMNCGKYFYQNGINDLCHHCHTLI